MEERRAGLLCLAGTRVADAPGTGSTAESFVNDGVSLVRAARV